MCDILTELSNREAKATFWTDANCGGQQMELGVGNYPNLDSQLIKGNQITSTWVPPHLSVEIYSDKNFSGKKQTLTSGSNRIDLENPILYIGRNDVESIKVMEKFSWNKFTENCCLNKSSEVTSKECDLYWGHTDEDGNCDFIISKYCEQNPYSEFCSCINSKAGNLAPCVDDTCGATAYKTKSQKEIYMAGCPNQVICNQIVELGEETARNIIDDFNMYQNCQSDEIGKENVDTQDYQSTGDGITNNNNNKKNESNDEVILIIVILIIALAAYYYYYRGKQTQHLDQQVYYQIPPYPVWT